MYKYTLAFLKRKDEILLLNRNKSPWMGAWNGVGGKLLADETPLACIQREIMEETDIQVHQDSIKFKGVLTWEKFDALGNGLYLYLVELDDDFHYVVPKVVEEGILDFKPISWATSFSNEGIAKNIPYFLSKVIEDDSLYHYHCVFNEFYLERVSVDPYQESSLL